MDKLQGVYKIYNKTTEKFYIGSSVNIQRRFKSHIKDLDNNTHNNQYLQNAWNKYGKDDFIFSIIEIVPDRSQLRERENYYIQVTNCTNHNIGYNMLNNTNIGLGVSASQEVKDKISKSCSGEKNGNYGRKHTKEELTQMHINRWGAGYEKKPRKPYKRKTKEELDVVYKKRAEYMRNRVVSETTRKKMSDVARNRTFSLATRKKMSDNSKGAGNPNAKLTKMQVYEIYEKMNSGINYKNVCEEYNICASCAYRIKRKEHWAFNDK